MNQQLCLLTYITIVFMSPTHFCFSVKVTIKWDKKKGLFLHFISKTKKKYSNDFFNKRSAIMRATEFT